MNQKTIWSFFRNPFHFLQPMPADGILPPEVPAFGRLILPPKGENLWNSVGRGKYFSRNPTPQGIEKELERLGQRIETARSFRREDYLEVTERMDRLEQNARKLRVSRFIQRVNDFYHDPYAAKLLATFPLKELPLLLLDLNPLSAKNTQQWSNIYNLLKGLEHAPRAASEREAIKLTYDHLAAKVDGPGLRWLENLVKDPQYARFAWHLLEKVRLDHPDPGIQRDAQRKSDRLRTSLDLRHLFRSY